MSTARLNIVDNTPERSPPPVEEVGEAIRALIALREKLGPFDPRLDMLLETATGRIAQVFGDDDWFERNPLA